MSIIDVRPVLYVIGALLLILAMAMLAPLLADLAAGHADWRVFGAASGLTMFFGVALMLANRIPKISLNLRQTFILTTLSWAVICLFGSLPFMFGDTALNPADAYFEAMSGLTTTGSTVIVGLDQQPPGLLLWRALLNWLGGVGIVGMGIVILPFLRVGGMQLFRSESSDKSDKVVPSAADMALSFCWIYLILTVVCTICLRLAGMSLFDAVCHSMASLATGGFSTKDASVGFWNNAAIDWIITLFMLLGSLPFVHYISLTRGNHYPLWHDSQVRRFVGWLLAISFVVAIYICNTKDYSFGVAFRHALFNIVSVVTTTGFVTTDYSLWGTGPVMLFFLLTFVGGCTGSTAGGIKMFRFEILWLSLRRNIARLFSPHRMLPLAYNGKPIDIDILFSVLSFTFVYFALVMLIALGLGVAGLDMITAVTGAATALGNVGPGLGSIIGPVGNFAPLPDSAKWMLSLAMLLGRLELYTVLVLLSPNFWRS